MQALQDFYHDLSSENAIRGKFVLDAPLAPFSWFRVGGPAALLFTPQDEDDLSLFLQRLPLDVPLFVLGLASNLLFRDGGYPGVVVRLGKGFAGCDIEPGHGIRAGAMLADAKLAKTASEQGIGGLSFFRGIPGCLGGAVRMNAGAHDGATSDHLTSVRALDRQGRAVTLSRQELGFAYRHCSAPEDLIFTEISFQGYSEKSEILQAQIADVAAYRELHQPTKERTGGSTFKNPPGHSAWKLIDDAGCRGLRVGGAVMSEKHCNFMINTGKATAEDLETLGETVRDRVLNHSGIELEWEIKRVGSRH